MSNANSAIFKMNFSYLQVTWLKNGSGKFFQFIKNRNPPFRNFTIAGAVIDVSEILYLKLIINGVVFLCVCVCTFSQPASQPRADGGELIKCNKEKLGNCNRSP